MLGGEGDVLGENWLQMDVVHSAFDQCVCKTGCKYLGHVLAFATELDSDFSDEQSHCSVPMRGSFQCKANHRVKNRLPHKRG